MDTIVITAPPGTKARWVRTASPGKLSAWVVKMIDEPACPERYLSSFAPCDTGREVVLNEATLREMMRAAYLAGARRE
jgi:hypothetical protein